MHCSESPRLDSLLEILSPWQEFINGHNERDKDEATQQRVGPGGNDSQDEEPDSHPGRRVAVVKCQDSICRRVSPRFLRLSGYPQIYGNKDAEPTESQDTDGPGI